MVAIKVLRRRPRFDDVLASHGLIDGRDVTAWARRMGLSPATVYRLRRGLSTPHAATVAAIARDLGEPDAAIAAAIRESRRAATKKAAAAAAERD